jgi:hypothetical protein
MAPFELLEALAEWVSPIAVDVDECLVPATDEDDVRDSISVPPGSAAHHIRGPADRPKEPAWAFSRVQRRIPTAHLGLVDAADDGSFGEFQVRNTGYQRWIEEWVRRESRAES